MGPSDMEIIQTSGGHVPNETHSIRASSLFPWKEEVAFLNLYSKDKHAHPCVFLHNSFSFLIGVSRHL